VTDSNQGRRIRGSGSGAWKAVVFIGVVPASIFAVYWPHAQLVSGIGLLLIAAFAARSAFIGVYVDPEGLTIVSWFRTRTFDRERVGRVTWRRYSGLFNRYLDDPNPTTPLWMVGMNVDGTTRIRWFPAILGSRKKIERVALAMAGAVGARSVRVDEMFS
jgi:hypothetical protein